MYRTLNMVGGQFPNAPQFFCDCGVRATAGPDLENLPDPFTAQAIREFDPLVGPRCGSVVQS
jgi:hypothetical protein